MILDKQVPTADPGELIIQYTPLIYKIERRYHELLDRSGAIDQDDLLQAGRLAICSAQKTYDPDGGASFLSYSINRIRSYMRRVLGFKADGTLPEYMTYLDEPLAEDSDETRLDFVPDTALTAEERIVEQDGRQETIDAVRAAVEQMKSDKQREAVTRIWLDGQDTETAAAAMGIRKTALYSLDRAARSSLRRDYQLKQYAMPYFHVGVNRFRSTWTSATEAAVIWRDEHLPEKYRQREEAGNMLD